jgi:hypothetical protein
LSDLCSDPDPDTRFVPYILFYQRRPALFIPRKRITRDESDTDIAHRAKFRRGEKRKQFPLDDQHESSPHEESAVDDVSKSESDDRALRLSQRMLRSSRMTTGMRREGRFFAKDDRKDRGGPIETLLSSPLSSTPSSSSSSSSLFIPTTSFSSPLDSHFIFPFT